MPAKTKKINRSARSTRSSVKKKSSAANFRPKSFFNNRMWLAIMAIAVVGAFGIFRANAAPTVPGGKASWQRFPGDPNPQVTGKTYWGANVLARLSNGSTTTDIRKRHEIPAGKSLAVNHSYFNCGNLSCDTNRALNKAKEDHAANRLPWLTFKITNWRDAASGKQDGEMDGLISALDVLGKPVWITLYHEPNDNVDGSTRTAATFVGMNKQFRARMNAAHSASGTKNIAFMPHFSDWAFARSNSNRNPDAWFAENTWDAITFSNYCQSGYPDRALCRDKGGNTFDTEARLDSINYIESKGLPWGVGEWSLSEKLTGPLEMTPYFQKYFDWAFNNKKDGKVRDAIVYSYFDADASRPNPDSPYYASLRDANLDEFHKIMNDPRVMRINDIPNITPTNPQDPGDNDGGSNNGDLRVTITNPKNGDTVSGIKKVTAVASGSWSSVNFRLINSKGDTWQTEIKAGQPLEWTWNTALAPNGENTVVARIRSAGSNDSVDISTKVNVNNQTTNPNPADLLKPSIPTALGAALRFDVTRLRYVMDLSWGQSRDDVSGVKQYQVVRDFTVLGNKLQPTNTTERVKFTDSSALDAGKTYRYTVTAIDGVPRTSDPATISIKTSCVLIFCNIEQL